MFEPDEMMASDWNMIETELGMGFEEWIDGIDARGFVATQGLIWFLRRQAGKQMDRTSVDFKIRQVYLEQIPKDNPEDTEPSEADTSSPSSTSSESDQATGPS